MKRMGNAVMTGTLKRAMAVMLNVNKSTAATGSGSLIWEKSVMMEIDSTATVVMHTALRSVETVSLIGPSSVMMAT